MELTTTAGHRVPGAALRTPEARALADLCSIISDLERVRDLCDLFETGAQLGNLSQSAFAESVVITYGRCFASGRRGKRRRIAREDLERLPPHLNETHEWLLRARNKHVGHRDDHLEKVTILAFDDPISGISGIGVVRSEVDHVDLSRPRQLAVALLEILEPRRDQEWAALSRSQQRPA